MVSKKTYFLLLVWLISASGLIGDAFATHISEPVLIDPKTQYTVGDTIILQGWVDYNAQPAPDVLLNFKLMRSNGTLAVDQSYASDAEGRFVFKFDTKNEVPGTYQITITSHCLEIHRYACTYKNQTWTVHLNNP